MLPHIVGGLLSPPAGGSLVDESVLSLTLGVFSSQAVTNGDPRGIRTQHCQLERLTT